MDSVRSVALGFWIGTGSSAEDVPEAGLSHLIEHMLFRGTARYGSLEIDQLFDTMGAELNAGTGKETTSVYARVLDVHLAEAFDVMADMVWRPRFDEGELAQEREIVLEEIAMYEDDPQDKVFDVLGEAVFGDHPLGRAIIGRAEVVGGAVPAALQGFHASRYVPANVVIAAAGSVDHDAVVELVRAAGVERPGDHDVGRDVARAWNARQRWPGRPPTTSAPPDDRTAERVIAEDGLAQDVEHLVLGVVLVHRDLLEDDLALSVELLASKRGGQTMSAMTSNASARWTSSTRA